MLRMSPSVEMWSLIWGSERRLTWAAREAFNMGDPMNSANTIVRDGLTPLTISMSAELV